MIAFAGLICLALVSLLLGPVPLQAAPGLDEPGDPGDDGPYAVARVAVNVSNPDTGSAPSVDIYYPADAADAARVDPAGAPYPALVFAHGFGGMRSSHAGNGQHLASWGYVVAISDLPEGSLEVRVSDVRYLLTYLEDENADPASRFYGQIDVERFGVVGHSMGGLTSMVVAARDERVAAAVALDPVNPPDTMGAGSWDYRTEAPGTTAPLAVIGAPGQMCNLQANYNDMLPYVGSAHSARYVLVGGSHCDFLNPDDALQSTLCGWLCGAYSAARARLARHYTAAWLNYYLHAEPDYYTYLYGAEAATDVEAGLITQYSPSTAVRGVTALSQTGAISLTWTSWQHPVIAGVDVYRSRASGKYPDQPIASLGAVSSYVDTHVVPGQRYYYTLRFRDTAGNLHVPSEEVGAVARSRPRYRRYELF